MTYHFEFIEAQLSVWQQARENYAALGQTMRRRMQCGDLTIGVQCNPRRIVSTAAGVSEKEIKARKCFLCKENRPDEQIALPFGERFEVLLNPFPIFPVHFTIASKEHEPQASIPEEVIALAEEMPGLTIFYNGAKAGASAPDHLHLQAVSTSELPLMQFVEGHHHADCFGIKESGELSGNLPFKFWSGVIEPTASGMKSLRWMMAQCGTDEGGNPDSGKVNAYFWLSEKDGVLRAVVIPRKAHRPECYYAGGEEKILVSPGAVDMAGVIILPRIEDYEKITEEDVAKIYSEVGY